MDVSIHTMQKGFQAMQAFTAVRQDFRPRKKVLRQDRQPFMPVNDVFRPSWQAFSPGRQLFRPVMH